MGRVLADTIMNTRQWVFLIVLAVSLVAAVKSFVIVNRNCARRGGVLVTGCMQFECVVLGRIGK